MVFVQVYRNIIVLCHACHYMLLEDFGRMVLTWNTLKLAP